MIATFDIETDPFLSGRIPEPFCCGFYDGINYIDFWGEDCVEQFGNYIKENKIKTIIYAHNGGKFDFFYLLQKKFISGEVKIVNGRILKAQLFGCELRDSYGAVPIPLGQFNKDIIDYNKFEKENRDKNKAEILKYLKSDCVYLHDLMCRFIINFGKKLTIGGASITEFKKLHTFEKIKSASDKMIRPFYFGGRTQCFKKGVIKLNSIKVYDVNSMYPNVMKHYYHPTSDKYTEIKGSVKIMHDLLEKNKTFFIELNAHSNGALPLRQKNNSLEYPVGENVFLTTSHEIKSALKYDLIKVNEVNRIIYSAEQKKFPDFVDKFIKEKIKHKIEGNKAEETFAKLILNSAYGKTGQNPENFYEWYIYNYENSRPDIYEWELYEDCIGYEIWRKPSPKPVFQNVGIAASVTGAARAIMIEAIANAKDLIYCDTDSLICGKLKNVAFSSTELGAWDLEKEGDTAYIAGKKLYTICKDNLPVKVASRGVRLTAEEIINVAKGEKIMFKRDAPSFSIRNKIGLSEELNNKLILSDNKNQLNYTIARFIDRKIKMV